ncbi:Thioesterase (fragment) [Pseudomonas sp. 8AS]
MLCRLTLRGLIRGRKGNRSSAEFTCEPGLTVQSPKQLVWLTDWPTSCDQPSLQLRGGGRPAS